MSTTDPMAKVKTANARYLEAKAQLEAAQEDLFDAYTEAARDGRSADELARDTAFAATYIRKKVRERGVEPRKGGPRPRGQLDG